MLNKKPSKIKAMFMPTAAIDSWAIEVLPKCMNDLLKCGIKRENVFVYDLHKPYNGRVADDFDVVYICGGNTEYLLNRINEDGFNKKIAEFIDDGGVLIGVSAGSIIFANNLENNLGLLPCLLDVHCQKHEKAGICNKSADEWIRLVDKQGIVFKDNNIILL